MISAHERERENERKNSRLNRSIVYFPPNIGYKPMNPQYEIRIKTHKYFYIFIFCDGCQLFHIAFIIYDSLTSSNRHGFSINVYGNRMRSIDDVLFIFHPYFPSVLFSIYLNENESSARLWNNGYSFGSIIIITRQL